MTYISKNLEFLINQFGINQSILAEETDLRANTISNWIRGVSTPDFNKIDSICKYFDVKPQDFIYKDLSATPMNIHIKASKGSTQSVQILDTVNESTVKYRMEGAGDKAEQEVLKKKVLELTTENESLKSKVSFLEGQVQLLKELMHK